MKTAKILIGAIALVIGAVLFTSMANEAPRRISGSFDYTQTLAAADSLSVFEFETGSKKVDAQITFDGSANATFIVQGSNIDGEWIALDTASYSGTAVTLTLTNLPRFCRVYVETAAANELVIGGKIYDAQ